MSLHHTAYIIVCDCCHRTLSNPDGTAREFSTNVSAIMAAREQGWLVNQKGNKDYCPECENKIEKQ